MVPPLITLEEHYVSSKVRSRLGDKDPYSRFPEGMISKLSSLSSTRISDMDAGSVSLQIISHGPLDASSDLCREANDELATATSKHSTRLAGFAMLCMSEPEAAAKELRRCVTEHKVRRRFDQQPPEWHILRRREILARIRCGRETGCANLHPPDVCER